MGRSGGMGQLAKGIIIGVVLLLAIIGTMSIFDQAKNKDTSFSLGNRDNTPAQRFPNVGTPSIDVKPTEPPAEKTTDPIKDKTAENPALTTIDKTDSNDDSNNTDDDKNDIKTTSDKPPKKNAKNDFKPTLENERILKEKPIEKPKYGLLQLSAINPNNRSKQIASFVVLNSSGKKVAEAKSVKEASFRLPVGKYKVITTLKKSSEARTRPVQSSQTIRISANKKTSRVFKLAPPATLGVLQVSAKNANSGKTIKANYIIQKENGKTIATRNNVTHTLFKLKAGSYKVTVKSGNNTDFRTIVVEPGESTKEVFKLQEVFKLGKVFVRVSETRTNKPINANIIITSANGTTVQQLKAVSQTELSLAVGRYKIRVTGPNGQSSKNITISAGQAISEVFRFDAPQTKPVNEVQITDNVKITPTKETPKKVVTPQEQKAKQLAEQLAKKRARQEALQKAIQQAQPKIKGSIKLFARNSGNNVPLKSNFYIQLANGKNIAKKVYTNSAQFSLEPGVYRVTVRSKNRKNIVKTIRVVSGQSLTEVFSLQSTLPPATVAPVAVPVPAPVPRKIAQAPARATVQAHVQTQREQTRAAKPKPAKPNAISNGFLSVAMQPPKNTHFIVATRSGKKIVELTSVPSAKFKLDTGGYVVTAIHKKQRRSKNINVKAGKTAHISFNATNFQPPRGNKQRNTTAIAKGTLRSRIVNPAGQPLRGNLSVTNRRGQIVARANSVSAAVFDLPPETHTVILDYNGLRGSERINIRSRETTMQTFTVAPDRSR